MAVHRIVPVRITGRPDGVERVRGFLEWQHHVRARQRVELNGVFPRLELDVALRVQGCDRTAELAVAVPQRPDVVAMKVHLAQRDARVDQPDQLPGLDRGRGALKAEVADVDSSGRTRSQALFVRGQVNGFVLGHPERTETRAVVQHEVARQQRRLHRVDSFTGMRAPRPVGIDISGDPQPLPLELGATGPDPPVIFSRRHDQDAVEAEHPLDDAVRPVVVDVRARCGGRELQPLHRPWCDRAGRRDPVDGEAVSLR